MKKALSILCMFVPMIASADYLDDHIANLTKQKQDKIAKLEECQKNTKGLKIAGITTLGVSAIGIGANIGEAVHLKKLDGKIAEAQDAKDDLAKQINAAKKTQNSGNKQDIVVNIQDSNNDGASMVANTCGAQNCVVSKESFLTSLAPGAVDAVCVNNLWYPSACKSGYRGVEKTCTLNNQIVNYVLSCVPGTLPEDKSGTLPEDKSGTLPEDKSGTLPEDKSGTSPEDKSGTSPEDKSGKKQVPAQNVACERTVFSVAESESGQCSQMCSEYAKKNNCNLLGESVYIAISGECICNPVPIDVRKASVKNSSEPVKIDCPDTELPNADLVRCNEKTGQLYIVTCKPGFKPILPLPDGGYMQCVKEEKTQPKQEETKEEDNSQKSVYETIKEENDA